MMEVIVYGDEDEEANIIDEKYSRLSKYCCT